MSIRNTVAWTVAALTVAAALGPPTHPLAAAQRADAAATGGPAELLGLDAYVPVPEDRPLTQARVDLGRRLFFDPVISADRGVACASCHQPARAFSDSRPRSAGVHGRLTRRNAPTLINVTWGRSFFWDGRERELERQVLRPIEARDEMGLTVEEAVRRIRTDDEYRAAFAQAFDGREPDRETLALALTSYVRTLLSGNAPIDRFYALDDGALSPAARRGYDLFVGRANCATCHVPPLFTDRSFHNTGVSFGGSDRGRYDATGVEADRGRFKTPTLRSVTLTAPYMHDGSIATLEEVIEHYDRGGGANPWLDPEIRPLNLSDTQKRDLVAFLHALTGDVAEGWQTTPSR